MVVMMENHGDGAIIGNASAPFENSLVQNYAAFTNSAGVDHPSAPNYVGFVSGQDNGLAGAGDCSASIGSSCNWSGANLGVQLQQAGISNQWYAEGLSGNGCSISNANSGAGDLNHMPWAYMDSWQSNASACANAGLTTTAPNDPEVISALNSASPPSFAWVTPNLTDDTHDGTVAQGDTYLKNLVTAVQGTSWYGNGGTILVTYDEDEGESDAPGYCTNPVFYNANNSNCIVTVAVSKADAGVGKVATPLDHFGVLGSIEKCYGLTQLALAAGLGTYGDITHQLCPAGTSSPLSATTTTTAPSTTTTTVAPKTTTTTTTTATTTTTTPSGGSGGGTGQPLTSLHFTANGNFSGSTYLPGVDGFNLADVGSNAETAALPSGVKGLAWVGTCNGADATFQSFINSFAGDPKVFGFYLMDEPDPSSCPAANLKAESDWVHVVDSSWKTFIIEQDLAGTNAPSYQGGYSPANSDIDLYGLDPYPCRTENPAAAPCAYNWINLAVTAAQAEGIPVADMVPVYQAFGLGTWVDDGGGQYQLPTAAQEQQILSTWGSLLPTPVFDYAYSWGVQQNDVALSDAPADLGAVFATHNG